jgi:M6 family metalloprotease-like protein
VVTRVRPGSPAGRAGLQVGDEFQRIDNMFLQSTSALRRQIEKKKTFTIRLDRPGAHLAPTIKPVGRKEEEVLDWKGKKYSLAVLLVEFQDRKHNAKYTAADFERLMFSKGEYRQRPDGQPAYGSLRDYYQEISIDQFDVEGKVFDWVQVPETWGFYDEQDMGAGDEGSRTIFQDAIKAARKKFGSDALDKYEGVVFLYAGPRDSLRGSQLWPHRASVRIGGKSKPYYIIEEGGEKFTSIGVHCHEFGHMLGLPDFYVYGHRTGVGRFCVMATGHQGDGESKSDRPFHMCAWCKIRLGWVTPTVVHPDDRQVVALRPIVGSKTEALKILISQSGDEYYLLENRYRIGFDSDFFQNGLVIWHVGEEGQTAKGQIGVAIDLEEAHGKRYFDASLREEQQIVFPNDRLDAFTPNTFPSSASNLKSAYEVFLTDMRVYVPPSGQTQAPVFPPGTVFFAIGDQQRAAKVRSQEPEQPVYPKGTPVEELDPVTELPVPFTIGDDNVAKPGPNIMPRPGRGSPDRERE